MAKDNPPIEMRSTGVYPEGHAKAGQSTGYKVTTTFNPRSEGAKANGGKMKEMRKFDPMIQKHVMFKPGKISRG
jgi:ribosomal protein L33